MPIQDGVYRIQNVKSDTYFDASVRDEGVIHGWASRPENDNQKWIVKQGREGQTLQNLGNGQYASISSDREGTRVEASGNPSEWYIADHGNGKYAIHPVNHEASLDLDEGREDNGASIAIWKFRGAGQQLWRFEPAGGDSQQQGGIQQGGQGYRGAVDPGSYRIHNVASGTVLDLAGGERKEGASIYGWHQGDGQNQIWEIQTGLRGYLFQNRASGTFLGFNEQPREGLLLSGGSTRVEWQVIQSQEGYQIVLAERENFVVDLAGGESIDGAKISLWHNGQGRNQQWQFNRA